MPNKSIEDLIDGLAISVAEGFARVESQMNDRFEKVNQRFDVVSQRFDAVEQRLERVEFLVTGQDQRLSIVEDKLRQVATKIGILFN